MDVSTADRPVKNLFDERIKNINAKYSFNKMNVSTAARTKAPKIYKKYIIIL